MIPSARSALRICLCSGFHCRTLSLGNRFGETRGIHRETSSTRYGLAGKLQSSMKMNILHEGCTTSDIAHSRSHGVLLI
jgi:hypothetical protein